MRRTLKILGTFVFAIAAIICIKLADLPGLVTAVLVLALLGLIIYIVATLAAEKIEKDSPTKSNPNPRE